VGQRAYGVAVHQLPNETENNDDAKPNVKEEEEEEREVELLLLLLLLLR